MSELGAALRFFWHPVCTRAELAHTPGGSGPLAVQLLDERIVVGLGPDGPFAMQDRCIHRSTRLSIGSIDASGLRCAYHGWCYDRRGRCVEIPAMPDVPVPPRARVEAYGAQLAYDLLWVCLDERARVPVPDCPAFSDPELRTLAGAPYTWPTSAPRRVENFVDLSHFAWVHDGSLGRRDCPVPPLPEIARARAELRFNYDPPDMTADAQAMYGHSKYRMPMPLTVNIEFLMPGGVRRVLWMTASPITSGSCRAFWFMSRSDDQDPCEDEVHMDFQRRILREDEPVVSNQDPPEIPLDPGVEMSVRTDKVSIEYRRWLRDIAMAASKSPDDLTDCLLLP